MELTLDERRRLAAVKDILNAGDTTFTDSAVAFLLDIIDRQQKHMEDPPGVPVFFLGDSGRSKIYILHGAFAYGGTRLKLGDAMGMTTLKPAKVAYAPENGVLWLYSELEAADEADLEAELAESRT